MTNCLVCETELPAGARSCKVCAKYRQIVSTAEASRKATTYLEGTAPGLKMTATEYASWYSTQDHCCTYCGISDTDIVKAGFRTQNGHLLKNMGTDRLDNSLPYQVGNIAECCLACNQVKSNRYSSEEMRRLSPMLREIHADRVAAYVAPTEETVETSSPS